MRAIEQVAQREFDEKRVRFVVDAYEQMTVKANTDFASRTGSYDIVLQYNAALANYVRNDYIIPLQEFEDQGWVTGLKDHLYSSAWREVGWYQRSLSEGIRPFGVPFSANTMLLCCCRSMFESNESRSRFAKALKRDLRPPRTWIEFEETANFFSTPETRGVALQGADLWNYYEWANLAFGSGGGVMRKPFGWLSDSNTPLIISSSETVVATELYLRLKSFSQFGQQGADFFATDAGAQVGLMRSGRYAMALMWSDVAYDLVHADMSWSNAFSFHVVPGDVSMLAGGSFYINRQSKSKADAESIVQRLSELGPQVELARRGLCPPRREVYQDSKLLAEIPYLSAVGASIERGVYMLEAGLDADMIMAALAKVLQELFRADGTMKVDAALAETQQQIERDRARIFQSPR